MLLSKTAQTDRVDKLPIYATFGITHAWLVDPECQTLEAFALNEGRWRLEAAFKAAEEVRAPPFEAVCSSLDALWP